MKLIATLAFALLTFQCSAQDKIFTDGPVIKGYGKHAQVNQNLLLEKNAYFKVAFDLDEQGSIDKVNRSINTLARFLNMHVANGIPAENIQLALVVHGKAGFDLLNQTAYKEKFNRANPNHELLALLMKNRVQVYLCGQSAAYYQIANEQLQSGVQMALSAMSAHAVLQNQGYSLNPF